MIVQPGNGIARKNTLYFICGTKSCYAKYALLNLFAANRVMQLMLHVTHYACSSNTVVNDSCAHSGTYSETDSTIKCSISIRLSESEKFKCIHIISYQIKHVYIQVYQIYNTFACFTLLLQWRWWLYNFRMEICRFVKCNQRQQHLNELIIFRVQLHNAMR